MGEPARNLHENLNEVRDIPQSSAMTPDEYATITQRFVAILIDGVVIAAVRTLLVGVLTALTHASAKSLGPALLNLMVPTFYMVFTQFNDGQTLGKRVMKIKTEGDATQMLSFGQVLGRETIGRFCSVILFFAGYLTAIRRPDKKTWRDRMFKTKVLKVT